MKFVIVPIMVAGLTAGAYSTQWLHGSGDIPQASEPQIASISTLSAPSLPEGNAVTEDTGNPGSPRALPEHIAQLKAGAVWLGERKDYVATFDKHERVQCDLFDPESVNIKIRHAPFSAYMRWPRTKREALFVKGQNANQLVVREGGLKGMFGSVEIEPTGFLAMATSRYSIEEIGLLELSRKIITYRERDAKLTSGVRHSCAEADLDGTPCELFVTEYASPEIEPVYRKCTTYLDKQHHLPLCVRNWGWPEEGAEALDDESTLIEFYLYRDVRFDVGLADSDFDVNNAQYAFSR